MADVNLVEAVNLALAFELEHDPSVVLLGEDIGVNGGVFRATVGLQARFGAQRVIDSPLAEAARRHAFELGPEQALTGPILRGDYQTVASHLRAVDQAPASVAGLYRPAGLRALAIARGRGLKESVARPIEELLRDNKNKDA